MVQRAMVRIGLPPPALFEYPDLSAPPTIQFPVSALRLGKYQLPQSFFTVSTNLLFAATTCVLYLTVVAYFNRYNALKKKPWAISRTRVFQHAVITHNLILTAFSAWAFSAALNSLVSSWPARQDELYLTRAADLICLGGEFAGHQEVASRVMFIGWLFYLSKFYEICDTAIIVLKGRQVSALHMYHHAGVIFCGCAVIRFSCTPVIIALVFNSAVHTVMYTYYSMTALRIPVLLATKAALTSLQIAQFFVGMLLGCVFVLLEYDVPFSGPRFERDEQQQYPPYNVTPQVSGGQRTQDLKTVRCVKDSRQAYVVGVGMGFVLYLMCMFSRFYVQSYLQHWRPFNLKKGVS
ncbi:uncharacterized protein BP01DRAFT_389868 [Aspergillus saccharolyticus JOP 1030-1]|uniref:Elongation of fatty acids protein n=1 Tax=Aspergillus saccharolyticus JOP 1030-1 TaxID=1450539 RepID=A0A318ZKL0_9EURO|nr:hypothetical protein BP01DRAFT_389868 [Aspergillus saccharolyticus JOP 1030-1]PYH47315.1 hypothetical protein BP01DRAFT_389868 [Aspergillus saccharolyticus JOP 1030-1]